MRERTAQEADTDYIVHAILLLYNYVVLMIDKQIFRLIDK